MKNFIEGELSFTPWEKLVSRVQQEFVEKTLQYRSLLYYYEVKNEYLEEINSYIEFDDLERAKFFIEFQINNVNYDDFIKKPEINIMLNYILKSKSLDKYLDESEAMKNSLIEVSLDLIPEQAELVEKQLFQKMEIDEIKELVYTMDDKVLEFDQKTIEKYKDYFYVWILKLNKSIFELNLDESFLGEMLMLALEQENQSYNISLLELLNKENKKDLLKNINFEKFKDKPLLIAKLFLDSFLSWGELFKCYQKLSFSNFHVILHNILEHEDISDESVWSMIFEDVSFRIDFAHKRIYSVMKDYYSMKHADEESVSKQYPEIAKRIKALNANFVFYSNNELEEYLQGKRKKERMQAILLEYDLEIKSIKKQIEDDYPDYESINSLKAIYNRMEDDAKMISSFVKNNNIKWSDVKGKVFGEWAHFVDDDIDKSGQLADLLRDELDMSISVPKEIDGFSYRIQGEQVVFNLSEYKNYSSPIYLSRLPSSYFMNIEASIDRTKKFMNHVTSESLKGTKLEGKHLVYRNELHAMSGVSERFKELESSFYDNIYAPTFNPRRVFDTSYDSFLDEAKRVFKKAYNDKKNNNYTSASFYIESLKEEIFTFVKSMDGLLNEASYDQKNLQELLIKVGRKIANEMKKEQGFDKLKELVMHILNKINQQSISIFKISQA